MAPLDSRQSDKSRKTRRSIAEAVDGLIRQFRATTRFREQVRLAAAERLDAIDEQARRVQARRDAVARDGTWVACRQLPKPPRPGYFHWVESFQGRVELPEGTEVPRAPVGKRWRKAGLRRRYLAGMRLVFQSLKERGFPDEGTGGFEYEFDVEAWLPPVMSPENDPRIDGPLPVPRSAVTLAEKYAALAAIYDACWAGSEKIAPWGVSNSGKSVAPWLPDARKPQQRKASRSASWYYHLVRAARGLSPGSVPIVRNWLADVEADLAPKKSALEAGKRGDEGSRKRRGRTPNPEIVRRNEGIIKMSNQGRTVDDICRRYPGVSAALVRRVLSNARLACKAAADKR